MLGSTKINGRELGVFLTLTLCLLVNLFFTIRVNEFKTSVQNGDLLMEERSSPERPIPISGC